MNPNIAANQQRLFLAFVAELRPHIGRDSALPRRIKELFARHRAIGSRDRKLYRELVYTYLRFFPWIDPLLDGARQHGDGQAAGLAPTPDIAAKLTAWLAPELKPTSAYRAAHCADWPAVPDTLAGKADVLSSLLSGRAYRAQATVRHPPDEPSSSIAARRDDSPCQFSPESLLPAWFRPHCPAAFESPHLDALNSRAGVWVRIQCNDRALVLDEFRARQWTFDQPADFPDALCLPPNAEVAGSDAYRRGFIEIQDLGSQLVLACAPIAPGGHWLDACAGAGGKTLHLSALMEGKGLVVATDVIEAKLKETVRRARRSPFRNVTTKVWDGKHVAGKKGTFDGVLVDAPCSAIGTWRRNPDARWTLDRHAIPRLAELQGQILRAAAVGVRPGGSLIYSVCTLTPVETTGVIRPFLDEHPEFALDPFPHPLQGTPTDGTTLIWPQEADNDAMFIARMIRSK